MASAAGPPASTPQDHKGTPRQVDRISPAVLDPFFDLRARHDPHPKQWGAGLLSIIGGFVGVLLITGLLWIPYSLTQSAYRHAINEKGICPETLRSLPGGERFCGPYVDEFEPPFYHFEADVPFKLP
jgi:hypothetical protein